MPTENTSMTTTPKSDGYWMPAEWYPHEAVWLVWPKNTKTWPGGRVETVEKVYFDMIAALLPSEKVKLLVDSEEVEAKVKKELQSRNVDCANLIYIQQKTADSWVRDFGPTFLVNKKGDRRWCKWNFNAWGEKYETVIKDTEVFQNPLVHDPCYEAGFILEGGSIDVNGKGTCLTTEQCLLNKNRNPHLTKNEIESRLKEFLGLEQVIWLKEGVAGDDTDGHVDDIVRFVNEDTIVAAYENDPTNYNYEALRANWEILEKSKTPEGKSWNLHRLPMPGPVLDEKGVPLPASYANFYIGNKVVLMPSFDDPNDDKAFEILKSVFPDKKIIKISCRVMVYGMGTVHCLSQQEPIKKIS